MVISLTGASGFLGSVIKKNLSSEYKLTTIGRSQAEIFYDFKAVSESLPQSNIFIHVAGRAHVVPRSLSESDLFSDFNINGTRFLLQSLEKSAAIPKSFIFISSVSVYGRSTGNLIKEGTFLNAQDPYGKSKIQAEKIILDWCANNNVICTVLRLPLIIGPNPPGNLKSMIKGIKKGYYFNIAGGDAKKSMVLAEDVAKIIPKASEVGGIYNLTDGYHPSFKEFSALIAKYLGKKNPVNIPNWLAMIMAKTGDVLGSKAPINSDKLRKITSNLTFDDSKAREVLGWNPTPVLEGFKIS